MRVLRVLRVRVRVRVRARVCVCVCVVHLLVWITDLQISLFMSFVLPFQ